MAQIYDRFQIENGHLSSQLIDTTLLPRFYRRLSGTVLICKALLKGGEDWAEVRSEEDDILVVLKGEVGTDQAWLSFPPSTPERALHWR